MRSVLIFFLVMGSLAAIAIHNAPEPKQDTAVYVQTDNPSVTVMKVFTHDGCTGYKADGEHLEKIYYVVCDGKSVETKWSTTKLVGKVPQSVDHQANTDSQ